MVNYFLIKNCKIASIVISLLSISPIIGAQNILYNLDYASDKAIPHDMNLFWSKVGGSPSNTNNISCINKTIIVQQLGVHYGVLESINDTIFTMSTYGGDTTTCSLSEIGSFFVKR